MAWTAQGLALRSETMTRVTERSLGESKYLLRRHAKDVDRFFLDPVAVTMVEAVVTDRVVPTVTVPLVRPHFGGAHEDLS